MLAMKAFSGDGIAPCVLSLGTRGRWAEHVVVFFRMRWRLLFFGRPVFHIW